jgi:hypothetical protein
MDNRRIILKAIQNNEDKISHVKLITVVAMVFETAIPRVA